MNSEWFDKTADDLTHILAAIMQIRPSKADRIVSATVAKLGAAGATAGVFGVASLVGTAGTGTAIGTLSGAAAKSATLAWVGGSVFTGTFIVIGIALISGWGTRRLWKGKRREYENLTESEQNIINACANLGKAFKEQAKDKIPPDNATMKFVILEGLVPLEESLEKYMEFNSIKHIAKGEYSFGSRVRLLLIKRRLGLKISEAITWVENHA